MMRRWRVLYVCGTIRIVYFAGFGLLVAFRIETARDLIAPYAISVLVVYIYDLIDLYLRARH